MTATAPRFYFGAMSPYSWFAAERIERLLPEAQWRGVLAGVVFKANDRVVVGAHRPTSRGNRRLRARAPPSTGSARCRPGHERPWPTSDLAVRTGE